MRSPKTVGPRVRVAIVVLFSIVLLATCIEAGRRYVLPGLLEDRILAALAERGLTDASVTLTQVTLSSASLENLTIDPQHRFGIDRIHVRYSLGSLRHGQVHSIVLQGADAEVRLQDGTVDVGPLAGLAGGDSTASGGPPKLPFDLIKLAGARLLLRIQDREMVVPVSAVLEQSADSLLIDVRASLESTDVRVSGSVHLDGHRTALHVSAENLEATLLREVIAVFVPLDNVRASGRIRVGGSATTENQSWRIQAAVEDDGFSWRSSFPEHPLEVTVEGLDGDLSYSSSGGVNWDLRTAINRAPTTLRGTLDVVSQDGQCDIRVSPLDAETLRTILSLQGLGIAFDGSASLVAHVESRAGVLQAKADADCTTLVTTVEVDGHPLRIKGARIGATMTAAFDGERLTRLDGKATVQHARLTSEHLKLSVPVVNCELPFSVDARTVEGGTFSAELLRVQGNDVTAIKGQISVREQSVDFSVTAFVLPEAETRVTGTLDLTASPPAGEIEVVIPRFTLESGKELMERFPELNAGDVGGDFSVAAHFEYRGDELAQRIEIDIEDGYFEPSNTEGRVDSVFGTVTLRNFEPPVTAGLQSLAFGSAVSGSFSGSNGDATFELREDQTVFVQSIRCDWLDGRIRSDSILVRPLESSLSCNVFVDSLSLQGILDFLDYDGVTGEGRIFGNLPVALSWGVGTTVSFGAGALEARPRTGRLRLSKETAMTILGLTVELDPRTASREDMAKALTLKALQDMQYSTLTVTFQRAGEDELLTRVQIQGYGPVGDPDSYVPIGGIEISISNLDDLLNNIILPALETRKVNLGS